MSMTASRREIDRRRAAVVHTRATRRRAEERSEEINRANREIVRHLEVRPPTSPGDQHVQLLLFEPPMMLDDVLGVLRDGISGAGLRPDLDVDVLAVSEVLARFPQEDGFSHWQAACYAAMIGCERQVPDRSAHRLLSTDLVRQAGPCVDVPLQRPSRHRTMRQCIELRRQQIRYESRWMKAEACGDEMTEAAWQWWLNADATMDYHNVLHGRQLLRPDRRLECAFVCRARAERAARPRGRRTRGASRRSSARSGDPPGGDDGPSEPPGAVATGWRRKPAHSPRRLPMSATPTFGGRERPDLSPIPGAPGFYEDALGGVYMADEPAAASNGPAAAGRRAKPARDNALRALEDARTARALHRRAAC